MFHTLIYLLSYLLGESRKRQYSSRIYKYMIYVLLIVMLFCPGNASSQPTGQPSSQPSTQPTAIPTVQPPITPSTQPSCKPTLQPSSVPTKQPLSRPTSQPSGVPTTQPTSQPSAQPTLQPILLPTSLIRSTNYSIQSKSENVRIRVNIPPSKIGQILAPPSYKVHSFSHAGNPLRIRLIPGIPLQTVRLNFLLHNGNY